MIIANNIKNSSLYEADYQLWIDRTTEQLRSQDFGHLDLANLIEEIEDLDRSEKHAISNYLRQLCEHLLKIKYWESEREMCFRGWDVEVTNFCLQIQSLLKDSPSLKNHLQENFNVEYKNGRKLCFKTSGINTNIR